MSPNFSRAFVSSVLDVLLIWIAVKTFQTVLQTMPLTNEQQVLFTVGAGLIVGFMAVFAVQGVSLMIESGE